MHSSQLHKNDKQKKILNHPLGITAKNFKPFCANDDLLMKKYERHLPELGLKGVLVVPVSESIWACNRLQIWPTGTRFLTGEVIPGVAALKSWTK